MIALNLRGLSTRTGGDALVDDALGIDLGDLLIVKDLPEWMPAEDVEQVTLGLSESISQAEWTHHWHGTPAGPYRVWVIEDPTRGRVDTSGSALAAGIDASETTLSLHTDVGRALWTTEAGDLPMHLSVGAEVVRVTALSGSTSPQTATVVRGVNGLTRPWPAGTPVRLSHLAVSL